MAVLRARERDSITDGKNTTLRPKANPSIAIVESWAIKGARYSNSSS